MTGRLPRVTAVAALRALRRAGWEQSRQPGSRVHLRHPGRPGLVTVPLHRERTLLPKPADERWST